MLARVEPVGVEEVAAIAAIVRQGDLDEIEGALGVPITDALMDGVTGSRKASKIVCDGKVLAVFGDADCPELPGVGVAWLISTVHVGDYSRAFLRVCKPEVAEMLTRHKGLINFIDTRNIVALRWLKWLGFNFEDAIPYGQRGELFYPFHLGEI